MASIMSSSPGVVSVLTRALPAVFSGLGGSGSSIFIVDVTYNQRTGIQVMHTFSDDVFVNLYTDRLVETNISGAMLPVCGSTNPYLSLDSLRSRRGRPKTLTVSAAGDAFTGLVVGYQKTVRVSDGKSLPTVGFLLSLLCK